MSNSLLHLSFFSPPLLCLGLAVAIIDLRAVGIISPLLFSSCSSCLLLFVFPGTSDRLASWLRTLVTVVLASHLLSPSLLLFLSPLVSPLGFHLPSCSVHWSSPISLASSPFSLYLLSSPLPPISLPFLSPSSLSPALLLISFLLFFFPLLDLGEDADDDDEEENAPWDD